MLRSGIINPELLAGLGRLRHTDTFVIADAGLPIPAGVPIVDLALVYGVPTFHEVAAIIADAITVERATIAQEAHGTIAETWVSDHWKCPLDMIPHDGPEGLKARATTASLVIRTGENTPYANVILRCGVPF